MEQEREGKLVPVCFCSRKLTPTQRKWAPREQETHAIIMALRKWSGWIGYQPVLVLTDHKSLEYWATEYVDTPSGPAGRRARWHETLSKFQTEVKYLPGKENIVADALSRWAYPVGQGLADVSKHGSLEATSEAHKIIEEERREEKENAFVQGIGENSRPRMLDLFSGTGSVGNAFREKGYEVVTVDSDPTKKANIPEDILKWDFRKYPQGHFDA